MALLGRGPWVGVGVSPEEEQVCARMGPEPGLTGIAALRTPLLTLCAQPIHGAVEVCGQGHQFRELALALSSAPPCWKGAAWLGRWGGCGGCAILLHLGWGYSKGLSPSGQLEGPPAPSTVALHSSGGATHAMNRVALPTPLPLSRPLPLISSCFLPLLYPLLNSSCVQGNRDRVFSPVLRRGN